MLCIVPVLSPGRGGSDDAQHHEKEPGYFQPENPDNSLGVLSGDGACTIERAHVAVFARATARNTQQRTTVSTKVTFVGRIFLALHGSLG